MKIGPLSIGWARLPESDRLAMGLEPWPAGWEALCVEWNDHGVMLMARPRKHVPTPNTTTPPDPGHGKENSND